MNLTADSLIGIARAQNAIIDTKDALARASAM